MMERTDEVTDEVARRRREVFTAAHARTFRIAEDRDGSALQLHQVADEFFALQHPIVFDGPRGTIRINGSDHAHCMSDLTSVPPSLTWFVPKYGRHTSAALVHDALLDTAAARHADDPRAALAAYEHADDVFRDALSALGVPPIRRTTMWAAVCFGTRSRTKGWPRALVLVWLAGFAAGTALLVASIASRQWAWVAIALALPVPASLLWGRQRRAGLIASYTAIFVAVPTLVGLVTYAIYEVAETLLGVIRPDRDAGPRPYTGFDFVPRMVEQRSSAS